MVDADDVLDILGDGFLDSDASKQPSYVARAAAPLQAGGVATKRCSSSSCDVPPKMLKVASNTDTEGKTWWAEWLRSAFKPFLSGKKQRSSFVLHSVCSGMCTEGAALQDPGMKYTREPAAKNF